MANNVKLPGELQQIDYPSDLDHIYNPDYHALSTDDLLESESMHITPHKVRSLDLQMLIHGERNELHIQQMIFEEHHPEWNQQKAMVKEAKQYFDTHPHGEVVDVSIQTNNDSNVQTASPDRVEGRRYRTFDKNTVQAEYQNAYGFELQKEVLIGYEQTAIKMVVGEIVSDEEKEGLKHYLKQKQIRWTNRASKPKDIVIRSKAEKNIHIFGAFMNRVIAYGSNPATDGDLTGQDIENILERLRHFGSEKDAGNKLAQRQRPVHPPYKRSA